MRRDHREWRELPARSRRPVRRAADQRHADTGRHVRLLPQVDLQPRGRRCPFKNPSDDAFRISINEGLAKLTIGPESAAPGTNGTPYSLQMTASVGGDKTWTISAGTLPPGLAIDATTGLISGTPTASGQFDFQVLAKMNADARSDTKALGIVVRDQLAVTRNRAVHGRAPRDRRGERSVRLAPHGDRRQRHLHVVADQRRASARPGHRRRRHLGDAHDRRRLPVHGDRDRHGRARRQLSGAHPDRFEARGLDAAPASRTAGALLPGRRSTPSAASCRATGGSSAGRCLAASASTARPVCSSGSRRVQAATA